MTNNPVSLGQAVKAAREARGILQKDLARVVGVSLPYISKIENNRETPASELLIRLARHLSVDKDEFFLAAGRLPSDVAAVFRTKGPEGTSPHAGMGRWTHLRRHGSEAVDRR